MNKHTARALLDDAVYQVLDNRVFRLLSIVVLGLVAPTFLVGIKEEGIVLLFGWKVISYADFAAAFGTQLPRNVHGLHLKMLEGLQALFVDAFAGTIGIMLCIAATAFFVPRMLEKGTADTLFSKPVSRAALLIARYFSGVLFVTVLACLLVCGMHLGILVASGYSDASFLWSVVTLVYTFALVHAVSTAIAAFTRNSVAAILATLMFFVFNGCIHQMWVAKEHGVAAKSVAQDDDRPKPRVGDDDARGAILTGLKFTLDALHYALPKTNDASVLSRKLRTAVTGEDHVLWDPVVNLLVMAHPEGFTHASSQKSIALDREPAVWTAASPAGAPPAEMKLARKSRVTDKNRRQSASSAARELEKALLERLRSVEGIERDGRAVDPSVPFSGLDRSGMPIGSNSVESVSWSETEGSHMILHRRHFFAENDWMYELSVIAPDSFLPATELDERTRDFLEGVGVEATAANELDASRWYQKQFGWTAPPKFNAFVSIGASLGFAAVMLALAWARVMRIDF